MYFRRMKKKPYKDQKKSSLRNKKDLSNHGWQDYNQGNLSAFDGDLGLVEVKMIQIIQEQDEKKEEKEKVKARQKRLG